MAEQGRGPGAQALPERFEEVAERIASSQRLFAVTGAGMSAESGLPTYRGVGGLYEGRTTESGLAIEEALSGDVFAVRPDITWSAIRQIEEACRGAQPNAAHFALAEFETLGLEVIVLTQNVDGLHARAGSTRIVDIHGDLRALLCTRCEHAWTVEDYRVLGEGLPECPICHGLVRPKVVLFNEMLPEDKLLVLHEELYRGFDVVLSIGTTSVFPYIAAPVRMARQVGALSVEINPARSEVSDRVDVRWQRTAGSVLPALRARVAELREGH